MNQLTTLALCRSVHCTQLPLSCPGSTSAVCNTPYKGLHLHRFKATAHQNSSRKDVRHGP